MKWCLKSWTGEVMKDEKNIKKQWKYNIEERIIFTCNPQYFYFLIFFVILFLFLILSLNWLGIKFDVLF